MFPLSKAKLKFFRSLLIKKYRQEERMFWVEGIKMYEEALKSAWKIEAIVVLSPQKEKIFAQCTFQNQLVYIAEPADFKELTNQVNPEGLLCLVHFPDIPYFGEMQENMPAEIWEKGNGFILENVQDPGNVGTILRIADWFGMEYLLCTEGTADILNPKTLRASMGAIFRVKVLYMKSMYQSAEKIARQIVVADMDGQNIDEVDFKGNEWIMMGNEANGVAKQIYEIEGIRKVTIPKQGGAESLNVSIAAGIFAFCVKNGKRQKKK